MHVSPFVDLFLLQQSLLFLSHTHARTHTSHIGHLSGLMCKISHILTLTSPCVIFPDINTCKLIAHVSFWFSLFCTNLAYHITYLLQIIHIKMLESDYPAMQEETVVGFTVFIIRGIILIYILWPSYFWILYREVNKRENIQLNAILQSHKSIVEDSCQSNQKHHFAFPLLSTSQDWGNSSHYTKTATPTATENLSLTFYTN